MACQKISIQNNNNKQVSLSYVECNTDGLVKKLNIESNSTKNIWTQENTLSIPEFLKNNVEIITEGFFPVQDCNLRYCVENCCKWEIFNKDKTAQRIWILTCVKCSYLLNIPPKGKIIVCAKQVEFENYFYQFDLTSKSWFTKGDLDVPVNSLQEPPKWFDFRLAGCCDCMVPEINSVICSGDTIIVTYKTGRNSVCFDSFLILSDEVTSENFFLGGQSQITVPITQEKNYTLTIKNICENGEVLFSETVTVNCCVIPESCVNCDTEYCWDVYDENSCYRVESEGVVSMPSGGGIISSSAQNATYSIFGTRWFDFGFPLNGNGTVVATSQQIPLWKSISFGPMNRSGIWLPQQYRLIGDWLPLNTWVGFSVCVDGLSEGKTYYLGAGGDNNFRVVLDGEEILNTINGPLNQYWTEGQGTDRGFTFWNVYPISIGGGTHVLEVFGLNVTQIASFGFELYDNTLEEMTTATTYDELNIIFSTKSGMRLDVFQNLNGGYIPFSGFSCDEGFIYSPCEGKCVRYIYCDSPIINCICFTLLSDEEFMINLIDCDGVRSDDVSASEGFPGQWGITFCGQSYELSSGTIDTIIQDPCYDDGSGWQCPV